MNYLLKYLLIVLGSAVSVAAQLLMRKSMISYNDIQIDSFITKLFSILFQPLMMSAIFCYGLSLLIYMFLISKLEITYLYPISTSLIFGGITVCGYYMLGESLNWAKISGISLIVIGIILIDRFG